MKTVYNLVAWFHDIVLWYILVLTIIKLGKTGWVDLFIAFSCVYVSCLFVCLSVRWCIFLYVPNVGT